MAKLENTNQTNLSISQPKNYSIDNSSAQEKSNRLRVIAILLFTSVIAAISTYLMYKYTEVLLTRRLQERLVAIASTAATQFNADEIDKIDSPEDMATITFYGIIEKLNKIRGANNNIQYAYIMRRTADKNIFEFVADADSLTSESELDINGDGILQDEESVPIPGDPYEVSEFPVLRDEAFEKPSVDDGLQPDQWGLIMAAYAPIVNGEGQAVAIIGIDVLVDDFEERTQEALLPFLIFVLALILLILFLTLMLIRLSSERVKIMKELDKQKDELLSIVSHQLATPVSSIKWYLEMLYDGDIGDLSKEQKEHVASMQGVIVNLVDLVHMILDVSRIQLGRMKVDAQKMDLGEFFEEILTVIKPKATEKNVQFNVSMPEKWPKAVLDRRLMHMTVENLLSNAVKYTPKDGKVDFVVWVKEDKLHYTVKDTGCGIPKEEQSKMFQKLYRASNVQKIDGNGFGLYVAKGAVESQGGAISFISEEKVGTTFTVILPLEAKIKELSLNQ